MSKFKEGDRVRFEYAPEVTGTFIEYDHLGDPLVRWDGEEELLLAASAPLTKITDPATPQPLRFSDVRTGDRITVEVVTDDEVTATFHGPVSEVGEEYGASIVRIGKLRTFYQHASQRDKWYLGMNDNTATLTAHTPAEPEWKRAKVIKAQVGIFPGPEILLRNYSDGWTSRGGGTYKSAALTNVTIIVDEHGEVRA